MVTEKPRGSCNQLKASLTLVNGHHQGNTEQHRCAQRTCKHSWSSTACLTLKHDHHLDLLAICWLPHLLSLMTSFSPCRRVSVVMVKKSNMIPAPRLAILPALSHWSAFRGSINMGTAWHSPSNMPCEPEWVMKARTLGWTNRNIGCYDVLHQCVSHFRMCCSGLTDLAGHSEAPISSSSHSLEHCQEPFQCTSIWPVTVLLWI